MEDREFLRRRLACHEAVKYVDEKGGLRAAWEKCDKPDWMIWFLACIGWYQKELVEFSYHTILSHIKQAGTTDITENRIFKLIRNAVASWLEGRMTADSLSEIYDGCLKELTGRDDFSLINHYRENQSGFFALFSVVEGITKTSECLSQSTLFSSNYVCDRVCDHDDGVEARDCKLRKRIRRHTAEIIRRKFPWEIIEPTLERRKGDFE